MTKAIPAGAVFLALMAAGGARCLAQEAPAARTSNASQTPPPAYTPPPKGALPAPDTPEQLQRLHDYEARALARSEAERQTWNETVTHSYDFHYGPKNPFVPGNLKVEGEGFLQPGAFPTAEYCGTCHQEAYSEWRQALHSNAFRTPFYRTSVNLLIRDPERGIAFARHCDSCHNPAAVAVGALTKDSKVDRARFDSNGVTCMVCHSVVKVDDPDGNGGLTLGVPAVMVDEKGNRIPGQVPFEEILRHPERHAQAVMHDFMHTPEFCAACHKANLPATLNDYKFVRAFTTYDEWQQSKFSQRNPLTFYTADFTTCQGCHMKRVSPTLPEYGAKNGTFASHRWLAGNTAVPFYYGFDEQLKKTIEFLRSGNYLNVDIFGLMKTGSDGLIAPLGLARYSLEPANTVEVYVVIQNKNIGHSLLPEVRDLYESWVEFTAKDDAGNEIYHSGFLKPDGMLDEHAHSFTNRPVTEQGDFVDNHKVWTIHSVAYDNTVQAGRSVLVRYMFRHACGYKWPCDPDRAGELPAPAAELSEQRASASDHPAYPVVELASRHADAEYRRERAGETGSGRQSRLDELEQSRDRAAGPIPVCGGGRGIQ